MADNLHEYHGPQGVQHHVDGSGEPDDTLASALATAVSTLAVSLAIFYMALVTAQRHARSTSLADTAQSSSPTQSSSHSPSHSQQHMLVTVALGMDFPVWAAVAVRSAWLRLLAGRWMRGRLRQVATTAQTVASAVPSDDDVRQMLDAADLLRAELVERWRAGNSSSRSGSSSSGSGSGSSSGERWRDAAGRLRWLLDAYGVPDDVAIEAMGRVVDETVGVVRRVGWRRLTADETEAVYAVWATVAAALGLDGFPATYASMQTWLSDRDVLEAAHAKADERDGDGDLSGKDAERASRIAELARTMQRQTCRLILQAPISPGAHTLAQSLSTALILTSLPPAARAHLGLPSATFASRMLVHATALVQRLVRFFVLPRTVARHRTQARRTPDGRCLTAYDVYGSAAYGVARDGYDIRRLGPVSVAGDRSVGELQPYGPASPSS